ncbi:MULTISPECIES: hypothetical protein [unclassified Cryobacterium]|uniref:hypothetical protein n=1 Tax=unclassified Cryobacterium TaxID=2649013 RepID=UPI002AB3B3F3|nr:MULTISPECIES: hypothetical protein [unclassified Cryobacterium]MDY7542800.1 hypothetical protein [Cryobacterium sp. 5B3]MEB0264827.1 hypothetical protein [Cryobacterium sp. 10I5]MEB0273970.1 hypothetical protein [Cryobacterium sp. 5B3]
MGTLTADIVGLGLFAKRAWLRDRGWGDGVLRGAVLRGEIVRVRKGWYTVPWAPPSAVEAVRIGGRLTGLSALRSYGLWTPQTRKLHVAVPVAARGLRQPGDMRARLNVGDSNIRVTWTEEPNPRRGPFVWRTSLTDTLVHILCTHDRVTAIVCIDAALHGAREHQIGITEEDLDVIFARAPRRTRSWRSEVDGRAEAGGETEFRLKCLHAGIPFVPQPVVVGVGRLDGQIGPSTFVEVDGEEWHNDSAAFEADRERVLAVVARNGRTLRFSYKLMRHKWELCERAMRCSLVDDYQLSRVTGFPAFPGRMRPRRTSAESSEGETRV